MTDRKKAGDGKMIWAACWETFTHIMDFLLPEMDRLVERIEENGTGLKSAFQANEEGLCEKSELYEMWVNRAQETVNDRVRDAVLPVNKALLILANVLYNYLNSQNGNSGNSERSTASIRGACSRIAHQSSAGRKVLGMPPCLTPSLFLPRVIVSDNGRLVWNFGKTRVPHRHASEIRDGVYKVKPEAVITYSKGGVKHTVTGRQLLSQYPALSKGIVYRNGEPDFEDFRVKDIDDRFLVVLDFSKYAGAGDLRASLHDAANNIVAERFGNGIKKQDIQAFMDHFQLTWHECSDGETLIAVPTVLHQLFTHTGGISISHDLTHYRRYLTKKRNGKYVFVQE